MIKKRFLIWMLLVLLVVAAAPVLVHSKEWNGIVPCTSTRSDVERLLGKDSFKVPDSLGSYTFKGERVRVLYDRSDKLNPAGNLVVSVSVYVDKVILLTKYAKRLPDFLQDFLRTALPDRVTHVYALTVYRNSEEGFEIWTQKDYKDREIITRFEFFDPADRCGK